MFYVVKKIKLLTAIIMIKVMKSYFYFIFKKRNFLFLLYFVIYFFLIYKANAAGMTEFDKVSDWIKDNLQGSLGKGISFFALIGLVGNLLTNPRLIVLAPLGSILSAIWLGPTIIEAMF